MPTIYGNPLPADRREIPHELLPLIRKAQHDGYLTYTKRQREALIVWFSLCDQANRPMITIRTGTKYGAVTASLQTMWREYSTAGLDIARALLSEVSTKPRSVQTGAMFVS